MESARQARAVEGEHGGRGASTRGGSRVAASRFCFRAMEATGDTSARTSDTTDAGGADAENTHTGGKRAVQDEEGAEQALNKKLCTANDSSKQDEDHCTFVIPSGEKFQISRAALQCELLNDTLLARLVASPLGTAVDASGAIEIGFDCSADAFSRVVDEFEWALRISTHHPDGEPAFLLDCAGPALRNVVHPSALAQLWDYLSMPKTWLSPERTHAGSTLQALVAHHALQRGLLLALQLQCFVQCIPNLPQLSKLLLSYATETEPNRMSFAVAKNTSTYKLGGRNVGRHFTNELFRLLESPAQVKELCRMHGMSDLSDQICVRACTEDDLRRVSNDSMPAFMPVFDESEATLSTIAASRPIGCFAVRVKRARFYSDSISKNTTVANSNVPLPCGRLDLRIVASVGSKDWKENYNGQPQLRCEASLSAEANSKLYARPDMPIPVMAIRLESIYMNSSKWPEQSIQWQRKIHETFFDKTNADNAGAQTSKLMPHDHLSNLPLDFRDMWTGALTPVPWAAHKAKSNQPTRLGGDINVRSEDEKRRAQAGDEGWEWVNFIFSISQSDVVPFLLDLDDAEGVDYDTLTTSDFHIVEMSG